MQRGGGVGENSNASVRPFGGFDFRSMFGGEDPFFTRPFGSFSEPDMFRSRSEPGNLQHTSRSKQLIIEEVDSDVDKMLEDEEHDAAWSNRNPLIEHPEDQDKDDGMSRGGNGNDNLHSTNNYKQEGMEPRAQSVSFQRETYGGDNGAYYTATTSRRSGNDGVTMEDSKQANRTTGQATHRISRGIRDKGHSVTRKLDSDGKVDTMQTLHNLNEDELMGFEQDWRGRHSQGLKDPFDFARNSGSLIDLEGFSDPWPNDVGPLLVEQSSREKPKKVVRIIYRVGKAHCFNHLNIYLIIVGSGDCLVETVRTTCVALCMNLLQLSQCFSIRAHNHVLLKLLSLHLACSSIGC